MCAKIPERWLHIYGQYDNHCPATIRGTTTALMALREAIDKALETGEGEADAYTTDGEGYGVTVERRNVVRHMGQLPYLMWEAVRANEKENFSYMREHNRHKKSA